MNEFETLIGFDTQTDSPAVRNFQAMQNKMNLVLAEASKIAKRTAASTQQWEVKSTASVSWSTCKM